MLYAAEGAPIGFLWWALPTRLRLSEVSLGEITTLTAVLALPWSLKFLWAPLVDVSRRSFRAWILAAQATMVATLAPLLWLDFAADFRLVFALLVAHAMAAATQDVAIDGLAIRAAPASERGALNGAMQASLLGARLLFGAGTLWLADVIDSRLPIALLIVVVAAAGASLLLVEEPRWPERLARWDEVGRALATMARARQTRLGLAVAVLAGAAFESVGAVAGPFLLDHGASERAVSVFYAAGVVAMASGALLGGWSADRWGRIRPLAAFVVLVAGLVALVGVLAARADSNDVLPYLLCLVYFGIGLMTASSYALFMDLSDVRLGATEFSAFMGATNLCESMSSFAVGRIHGSSGYPIAFVAMAAVSLLSLAPLRALASLGSRDKRG